MTGAELRHIREEYGLTQAQLAEKLGLKSYMTISHYECGHRAVPEPIARLLTLLQGGLS